MSLGAQISLVLIGSAFGSFVTWSILNFTKREIAKDPCLQLEMNYRPFDNPDGHRSMKVKAFGSISLQHDTTNGIVTVPELAIKLSDQDLYVTISIIEFHQGDKKSP